jgi:hypothetical protein
LGSSADGDVRATAGREAGATRLLLLFLIGALGAGQDFFGY